MPVLTRSQTRGRIVDHRSLTHKRGNWERVYAIIKGVDDIVGDHPHLASWRTTPREMNDDGYFETTYYQTYGGGPEGGYFLNYFIYDDGRKELCEIAEVRRGWREPFRFVGRLPQVGLRVRIKKVDGVHYIKITNEFDLC